MDITRYGAADPRAADVSDRHVCGRGIHCCSVHDRGRGPVTCDFRSVEAVEAFMALVREHGARRLTVG